MGNKDDGKVDNILSSLQNHFNNGTLEMNENIFSKIKPLHECLQNLSKHSTKGLIVRKAKSLLIEWNKFQHQNGGKKRKLDRIQKKNKRNSKVRLPPRKRQKIMKKIKDSDSESEVLSDSEDGLSRRRSLRKSSKKKRMNNKKIMQSDIYGNESE